MTGSDSQQPRQHGRVLLMGGVGLFRAHAPADSAGVAERRAMDADMRAFYEYNSMHMEPWDGPPASC